MSDDPNKIHDTNLNLLISGYFRKEEINTGRGMCIDIPAQIIKIIIAYFEGNHHMIIFTRNPRAGLSEIKMIDIGHNYNEYSFRFETGSLKLPDTAAYYVEYEMHPNLQKYFNEKQNDNHLNVNSMIIRCTGAMNVYLGTDIVLFDSNKVKPSNNDTISYIDAYIHSMPFHVSCMSSLLYDKYNNVLLSVGGEEYEDDWGMFYQQKSCRVYDFNQHKGRSFDILPQSIIHPGVAMLDTTSAAKKEYLICGGGTTMGKGFDSCFKLDGSEEEWKLTALAPMNKARCGHCVCHLKGTYSDQIMIGGGQNEAKSFEMYDINKNKWSLMKETSNYAHVCGTMWSDKNNPNIVYIAGTSNQEARHWDKPLSGFIEYKDLRNDEGKWQIVMDQNKPFDIEQYGQKNKIYSIIV